MDTITICGGMKWELKTQERLQNELCLERYGYRVYSQNDEDGIIYEIFRRIGTKTKRFIEFGAGIGLESNTHSLLLQGWSGLWIEGNSESCRLIKRRFAPAIRRKEIQLLNTYITKDNVNQLFSDAGFEGEIDLLSIDIDGNDYHIWESINVVNPRVVIIEYNAKLTPEIDWCMAYNENHIWDRSDKQGASLKAYERLGREKGYQLVGTSLSGVNAFFVRSDLAKDKFYEPATAEELYNPNRWSAIFRYHNGHYASNFLGQDIEGMAGVFEYYPDWRIVPSYGFVSSEALENGSLRRRLGAQEAKLFYRTKPGETEIHLNVFSQKISNNEKSIHLQINEEDYELKGNGEIQTITLPVSKDSTQENFIPIVLQAEWYNAENEKILNADKLEDIVAIDCPLDTFE